MPTKGWRSVSTAAGKQPEEAVTLLGVAHSIRETYGVAASLPERTEGVAQLDALHERGLWGRKLSGDLGRGHQTQH